MEEWKDGRMEGWKLRTSSTLPLRRSSVPPPAPSLRSPGEEVHGVNVEVSRDVFLRGSAEAVEPLDDPHVHEAGPGQPIGQLCLRQSAGDSAGPEVDVLAYLIRELRLHH